MPINQQIVVDFQTDAGERSFFTFRRMAMHGCWLRSISRGRGGSLPRLVQRRLPKESQGESSVGWENALKTERLCDICTKRTNWCCGSRGPTRSTTMIEIGEGHLMIEVQDRSSRQHAGVDHSTGQKCVKRPGGDQTMIRAKITVYPPKMAPSGSRRGGRASQEHHHPNPDRRDVIQCNNFLLDAETITCKSRRPSVHQESAIRCRSPATGYAG